MRLRALVGVCVVALAVFNGCGGDDGDGKAGSSGGGVQGAEKTVKSYLQALVEKDGETACSLLSEGYKREIVERNPQAAKELGATDCETLVRKIAEKASENGRGVTFEGEPIKSDSDVERLDLKTAVQTTIGDGEKDRAVVKGPKGLQVYRLAVIDGRWTITRIG